VANSQSRLRALRREASALVTGRAGQPATGQALTIEVQRGPGHVVVTVAGEADIATAAQLEETLSALAADGQGIVADLTRVSFIDAAGLRALSRAAEQATVHGTSLQVVCDRPHILRLFRLTGLDRRITLAPALAEALRSLSAATASATAGQARSRDLG
jgi:anti-sigma B factor antagonist